MTGDNLLYILPFTVWKRVAWIMCGC